MTNIALVCVPYQVDVARWGVAKGTGGVASGRAGAAD